MKRCLRRACPRAIETLAICFFFACASQAPTPHRLVPLLGCPLLLGPLPSPDAARHCPPSQASIGGSRAAAAPPPRRAGVGAQRLGPGLRGLCGLWLGNPAAALFLTAFCAARRPSPRSPSGRLWGLLGLNCVRYLVLLRPCPPPRPWPRSRPRWPRPQPQPPRPPRPRPRPLRPPPPAPSMVPTAEITNRRRVMTVAAGASQPGRRPWLPPRRAQPSRPPP